MKTAAVFFALVVLGTVSAALASQPGQPMDCTDSNINLPGITCRTFAAGDLWASQFFYYGANNALDNDGHMVAVGVAPREHPDRIEIARWDGLTREVIAWIYLRRASPTGFDTIAAREGCNAGNCGSGVSGPVLPEGIMFDPVHGRLLVPLISNGVPWIAAFEGFTTLYDISQSYVPQMGAIEFRVPVMPEGFRAAEHFDSYWGAVTNPLDLSQAQPLQCNYPDTQPQVGDYMSIATPVPTPAPGHANYVLTAVTYQGQTRAGRQAIDGTPHGRDASALPECSAMPQ